ncbi:hypothetical protein [Brevundimonas bacteroides]|uniref:hypothetical protein n=1 Tax=Brevundimonas bacteroides TaxID=74311 RepID=UPI00068F723A|nr:hypothetical protein [Brevundimonas bacteroides]
MSLSILMAAVLAQAQTPAPTPAAPLDLTVPPVAGVSADPTCAGRPPLAAIATCVVTTQAAVEGVIDAWSASFSEQGWLAAGGDDNRVVYIRRRPEGGCDGFQVMAFADGTVAAPAAPAYLAMAAIPGDVCAAQPTTPSAPTAPQ